MMITKYFVKNAKDPVEDVPLTPTKKDFSAICHHKPRPLKCTSGAHAGFPHLSSKFSTGIKYKRCSH